MKPEKANQNRTTNTDAPAAFQAEDLVPYLQRHGSFPHEPPHCWPKGPRLGTLSMSLIPKLNI